MAPLGTPGVRNTRTLPGASSSKHRLGPDPRNPSGPAILRPGDRTNRPNTRPQVRIGVLVPVHSCKRGGIHTRRTTAKLKFTVAWAASMNSCGWRSAGMPSVSAWRHCRKPPGRPAAGTSLGIRRSPQGGSRDVALPSPSGHPAPGRPAGVNEVDDGVGPDLGEYCAVFARTPPQHRVPLGEGGSSPGQQAVMHPA